MDAVENSLMPLPRVYRPFWIVTLARSLKSRYKEELRMEDRPLALGSLLLTGTDAAVELLHASVGHQIHAAYTLCQPTYISLLFRNNALLFGEKMTSQNI
jgi:hypothetical protein